MSALTHDVPVPDSGRQVEPMTGLTTWRNGGNGFLVIRTHYLADPKKRGDWRMRAAPKYGGLTSWRWRKEQEIDWDAQAGSLIFDSWDNRIHWIRPFSIPEHWPRWIHFDPGWRNPSAMIWMAVDVDTEPNEFGFRPIHFYREFYKGRHSATACARVAFEMSKTGEWEDGAPVLEWVEGIVLDPMAKQEHQSAAAPDNVNEPADTVFQQFRDQIEALGWTVPVLTGNNDKINAIEEIITRLGNFWLGADGIPLVDDAEKFREPDLDELVGGVREVAATMFFHESCVEGPREMQRYRWRDWAAADVAERHNLQEKPIDKDDHIVTCVIRAVNMLRELRGEKGVDLEEFQPRSRPKPWTPDDEMIEKRFKGRAARFRRQALRKP